jgi:hypothetical protein
MGLPEREMELIGAVLARARSSASVLQNLTGLLSEDGIRGYSELLLTAQTR